MPLLEAIAFGIGDLFGMGDDAFHGVTALTSMSLHLM